MKPDLTVVAAAVGLALLSACVAVENRPGVQQARDKLSALQTDPVLSQRAPAAIQQAEKEVAFAEVNQYNDDYDHRALVYVANREVDIARAEAEAQLARDQVAQLDEQREQLEVAVQQQRAQGEIRTQPLPAQTRSTPQPALAPAAPPPAQLAMLESQQDYRRDLAALNAIRTDHGMVMMIGELPFAPGRADLADGRLPRLDQLVAFLERYPQQSVLIEGHTDNVGEAAANLALSERRAEAVKRYLTARGIAAHRLATRGRGEEMPISGNSNAAGRRDNQRIEIVVGAAPAG